MKFYRNLFAAFCFGFFIVALATKSPYAFWGAMLCGALSRTATKKGWPDPSYARFFRGIRLFNSSSGN
ncbi:MAG TPA: hypothetical protein PLV56_08665 [Synergistales bacterium]|nr:hypothetical protein [Synergistales bacterium]